MTDLKYSTDPVPWGNCRNEKEYNRLVSFRERIRNSRIDRRLKQESDNRE